MSGKRKYLCNVRVELGSIAVDLGRHLLPLLAEEDGSVLCEFCNRREPYQDCVWAREGWVCMACWEKPWPEGANK